MNGNGEMTRLEDASAENTCEMTANSLLKERLRKILATLPEREREVLTLRFGLDDGHPRTLDEIGRKFTVTRERIRQIEAKALRKEFDHPLRMRLPEDQIPGEWTRQEKPSNPAQEGEES